MTRLPGRQPCTEKASAPWRKERELRLRTDRASKSARCTSLAFGRRCNSSAKFDCVSFVRPIQSIRLLSRRVLGIAAALPIGAHDSLTGQMLDELALHLTQHPNTPRRESSQSGRLSIAFASSSQSKALQLERGKEYWSLLLRCSSLAQRSHVLRTMLGTVRRQSGVGVRG